MLSGPGNAYGLMRAAIRDDNPVAVLEAARPLRRSRRRDGRGEEGIIPLGQAATPASGDDRHRGVVRFDGADLPERRSPAPTGWTADVIDLQTLQPWDTEAVLVPRWSAPAVSRSPRSARTRAVGVPTSWPRSSPEAFGDLKAPPIRITAPDVHVPFGKELEQRYLPSAAYVTEQIGELLATGESPPHWWERDGALV